MIKNKIIKYMENHKDKYAQCYIMNNGDLLDIGITLIDASKSDDYDWLLPLYEDMDNISEGCSVMMLDSDDLTDSVKHLIYTEGELIWTNADK